MPTYGGLNNSHRSPPARVGHPRLTCLATHRPKNRRPSRNTHRVRASWIARVAGGIGPLPGVSGFSSVVIADRAAVAGGIATCHAVTVESVAARETFLGISGFAALGTGVNPVGFVGVVTPEVRIFWLPFRSGFGER